jgi:hypothetical protein
VLLLRETVVEESLVSGGMATSPVVIDPPQAAAEDAKLPAVATARNSKRRFEVERFTGSSPNFVSVREA